MVKPKRTNSGFNVQPLITPGRRRPMFTFTHRRAIGPALAAAVLAAVVTASAAPATAQARTNMLNGSGQPWRNPGQPPGVRASELLAALNTDQKIQLALGNFAALESFGVPVLKADD